MHAAMGEGGERGHADADEAGGDFGGAPEEDLGLVVGDVGAGARFDADGEADGAEGGGAAGGVLLGGWRNEGRYGLGYDGRERGVGEMMVRYLQEAESEEQNHSYFSLHGRVEGPGDLDGDQQEE